MAALMGLDYATGVVERGALQQLQKRGVVVVPHGNYIERYPNHISRQEALQQLDLPGGEFVYLFLGLLRPYKGVEDLIDAFNKLAPPTGRLLIVGI